MPLKLINQLIKVILCVLEGEGLNRVQERQ